MELGQRLAQDVAVFDPPTDFCRLFMFRHPELDPAHAERAVGAGPADLSRRGRAQVLGWLDLMKPIELHSVYSSPQPQCQGPAGGLADSKQLELAVEERLRDQEMGRWQGRTWSDVMQEESGSVHTFFADFGDSHAPEGESLGDAVERILQWWAETMRKGVGKSLAVVLPGSLLTGFAAAMLGMRLSRCVALNLPHGGVGVLDVFQNGAKLASWNPGALAPDK